MADRIGRADYEVRADQTGLVKDLKDVEGKFTASGDKVEKGAGRMASAFESKITKAATVGGMAVGAFAVSGLQDFARFEKGMDEVFTLMPGITKEAMGSMTGDVKAFARETGTLPDDVIPALYNSLSAGVPKENVFEFLRESNKLAKAGATDVGVAVGALTSLTNAYGVENLPAADASNILFTAVKQGKTTVDEMGASVSTVAPLAAGLGIKYQEVASAMAAMTSQGEPTAGAATKIKGLMAELAQPTSKISGLFQDLAGKSFPEFIAGGGTVQEALQMIGGHADATGAQASTLANSVEAGMALMMLTSKTGSDQFGTNMDAMADRTGAVDKAFDTMEDGVQAKTDKIVAFVKTMALDVGEVLAPAGPFVMMFGPQLGKALGAAIGGLGGFLSGAFVKMMLRLIPNLLPASMTVGTVTGTAQGNAQATAATSGTVIKAFVAKILATSIPLGAAGTTVGTAVGAAFAAAAVFGVGALLTIGWLNAVNEAKTNIRENPNTINPEDMFSARAPQWARAKIQVAQEMQALGQGALAAFNVEWDKGIAAGLSPQDALGPARAAGLAIGGATTDGWVQATAAGQARMAAAFATATEQAAAAGMDAYGEMWVARGQAEYARWAAPFVALGERIPGQIGQGMQSQANVVLTAADTLRDILENGLGPKKRALELIGQDYIDLVRAGMASKKDGAKETAQEVAIAAINTIEDAALPGERGRKGLKAIGIYYDELLAGGMTAAQARVALAAGNVSDATIDAIEARNPDAKTAGETLANKTGAGIDSVNLKPSGSHLVDEWLSGMTAKYGYVKEVGKTLAGKLAGALAFSEPPAYGPLHSIREWMPHMVDEWLGTTPLNKVTAHGRLLAGALSDTLSMPSLGVPSLADFAIPRSGITHPGFGGPIHHELTVTVRDPDGGLARAGMTTAGLGRSVADAFAANLTHAFAAVNTG